MSALRLSEGLHLLGKRRDPEAVTEKARTPEFSCQRDHAPVGIRGFPYPCVMLDTATVTREWTP